jgi:hypothetical protein
MRPASWKRLFNVTDLDGFQTEHSPRYVRIHTVEGQSGFVQAWILPMQKNLARAAILQRRSPLQPSNEGINAVRANCCSRDSQKIPIRREFCF